MLPSPPATITFLFTDIEGSTHLWERFPEAMQRAHARHNALLRAAVESHGGHVFATAGMLGDGFRVAFSSAPEALAAALQAQRDLQAESEAEIGPLRVRMALHACAAESYEGGYLSPSLSRLGRLQGLTYGGQVLLTQAVSDLAQNHLSEGASLKDLGAHRLRDLQRAEHIFQLTHPALPDDFPPLRSLDTLPSNLPVQVTSFIGREEEMAEAKRLLGTTRLLTLTGAGGCGKTRLALQVGAEELEGYSDGVWLAELAALSDGALVPQTVATALGLKEQPGKTLTETLTDYLRSRSLLLVLDNCEHLVEDCARLADALLRHSPNLRILATSRETLHIPGELVWRVPSLGMPDPDCLPLEEKNLPAVLLEYDAVRLFVERARSQRTDFALSRQNASAIAQVCHRLDGIPLALELAAARVKALSVEQIAFRLDHRFRLLTGGSRTALPRLQTLRALIDWSYDLLTEEERTLLRRLSVFAGGWTLEAAEVVCSAESAPPTPNTQHSALDVFDVLSLLIDKSLVVFAEQEGGEGRYRLLETVRQYGWEHLEETGERDVLRARHLDFFLQLAEEARLNLDGPEQAVWFARLETEHDNLREALRCAVDSSWLMVDDNGRDPSTINHEPTALRLAGALQKFWWTRGHLSEGREWLTRALAPTEGQAQTKARATALNGAGALAWFQGDYASARTYYEDCLTIYRGIGDPRGIANSQKNLSLVVQVQGDYGAAREMLEESLAIFRELGDSQGIANSLNNLGLVFYEQSDYASARALYHESLSQHRKIGDRYGIAYSLHNLGNIAHMQGDYSAAHSLYEESLALRKELGDKYGIALSLNSLGGVATYQGDHASARALYEECLVLTRELGDRRGIAMALYGLGVVACHESDYLSARECLSESLQIAQESGDKYLACYSLEAWAGLAQAQRQWDRAAALWGAAERLREEMGAPLPLIEQEEYKREVEAARQAWGEAEFAAAWEEGRRMTLEQAVAVAPEEDYAE